MHYMYSAFYGGVAGNQCAWVDSRFRRKCARRGLDRRHQRQAGRPNESSTAGSSGVAYRSGWHRHRVLAAESPPAETGVRALMMPVSLFPVGPAVSQWRDVLADLHILPTILVVPP